jgi:serine/threonine-protein kinase RsbW
VVVVSYVEPRVFSEVELGLARLLGHQAGQALDRARLHDDARRRAAWDTFLAETSRSLDEVARLQPRAERLVARMAPELADWAAVQLYVGEAGVRAEAGNPPGDPDRLAEQLEAAYLSGTAQLPVGPGEDCAVLPLLARGRTLGTLALRLPTGERALGEAFLTDLAERAALALENARLYEQERAIARTLQRSLLAGGMPADPSFTVETHHQPATDDLEVGGDWYDAFLITGDKLAVVIGDVVGRGIDAASTMGQLRSAIRALASAEAGPARLLERLDRFVDRVESARMATVGYAEITLSTGEMTYACAGHLPPLLQQPGAEPAYLWGGRSAPLGSWAGRAVRTQAKTVLPPGSRLLLYTDGLIERRGRSLDAGFALLAKAFELRAGAPLPNLTREIAGTLVGAAHPDDVCLLCVALGAEKRLERTIPADVTQVAALRKDLRLWLAANAVDDDGSHAILLACSEAVANAVEHGYRDDPLGTVQVAATMRDDAIEVVVRDQGVWRDGQRPASRGRGLELIRQVMDEVSIEHDGGTSVTMRRVRPRPASGRRAGRA